MSAHLFFTCPTDYLESIINNSFPEHHYFYSSLGNSVVFDLETVADLNALIEAKNISSINFILASDNRVVNTALSEHHTMQLEGLIPFNRSIRQQYVQSFPTWKTASLPYLLICAHLKNKLNEIKIELYPWLSTKIKLNCMVYDVNNRSFKNVNAQSYLFEGLNMN